VRIFRSVFVSVLLSISVVLSPWRPWRPRWPCSR